MEESRFMRVVMPALMAVVFASLPATAKAVGTESEEVPIDRYVLSLRADLIQIHSDVENYFAIGGSAGIHVPFSGLPLGLELMTSLGGGNSHLMSTSDISLRYYLPASGNDPGKSLQPFVKAGPTVSVALWDAQGVGVAVGGGLGLGLHAWAADPLGLTLELTYRLTGGDELRQTMILSIGIAFGL